jgi:protoporphyrin/coproporphyrin ferrochelatase
MNSHPSQPIQPAKNRVAVLLAGYGEVQSYRELRRYNQAATKYIAAQFISIPEWLYPIVGWLLSLQDLYNFGVKHQGFMSPENEIFEKQRFGIETCLKEKWGDRIEVFKGFYFCEPFLKDVVADIIEQGFQNLLIYPLLVVASDFTGKIAVEQFNEVISATTAEKSKEPLFKNIRYISSFATESSYVGLMVSQMKNSLEQPYISQFFKSQIGIILTVHGGPEKASGLLTGVIDGQILYDRICEQLQHQYPLISIGWINHDTPFVNWSQPNLKQASESLIKAGAQAILFKPIGWATENYETILDVDDVIQSLKIQYPDIAYVRFNCANDDPEFLSLAAGWANPHIEEMLAVPLSHESV